MRGRKSNAESIIKSVVSTLKQYEHGLTLRDLSRKSGIPKSTLAYHLERALKEYVEETTIRPKDTTIARLIRLKPSVKETLKEQEKGE